MASAGVEACDSQSESEEAAERHGFIGTDLPRRLRKSVARQGMNDVGATRHTLPVYVEISNTRSSFAFKSARWIRASSLV